MRTAFLQRRSYDNILDTKLEGLPMAGEQITKCGALDRAPSNGQRAPTCLRQGLWFLFGEYWKLTGNPGCFESGSLDGLSLGA